MTFSDINFAVFFNFTMKNSLSFSHSRHVSTSLQVILTGHPIRVRKKFAVVKHMFYDPMDVRWFKPAEMVSHSSEGASFGLIWNPLVCTTEVLQK